MFLHIFIKLKKKKSVNKLNKRIDTKEKTNKLKD